MVDVENKQLLDAATEGAYYSNPALVKFLLAENLALKWMLHDKGIISTEAFAQYQKLAIELLDKKVENQLRNN